MAQAFDTLKTARALEAGGFKREQAEAITAAIRNGQGDLATRAVLETALAKLETRLTDKFIVSVAAIVAANSAITFGLLKLLLP